VPSQPVSRPGAARRRRPVPRRGWFVAVLVAGCAGGGFSLTSPPTVAPASPATLAPIIRPLPAITPVPAVSPAPSTTATVTPAEMPGPPSAALTPVGADAIAGELGSFTWQGIGSDAPWLVPLAAEAVQDAGPYTVTFVPPLLAEAWTARWAPVVDGAAGDVAGSEQGGDGPLVLDGPVGPGTWSLQVAARFAGGDRGTYYWRLEVAP
jgi:hypothetical protein